ncbi:hypothetical protein [Streptomyces mirabilis]|uniref:hypothetical protein n=1 Tax=Streptomyces mirabilis TaxID=68239 RepID=UPI0036CEF90E
MPLTSETESALHVLSFMTRSSFSPMYVPNLSPLYVMRPPRPMSAVFSTSSLRQSVTYSEPMTYTLCGAQAYLRLVLLSGGELATRDQPREGLLGKVLELRHDDVGHRLQEHEAVVLVLVALVVAERGVLDGGLDLGVRGEVDGAEG